MQIRKKGDEIKKKSFGHLKIFLFLVMAVIWDTGRR
jgi:hypothetical protein